MEVVTAWRFAGTASMIQSMQVGGNRTRAAEVLGIDRRTLYRMAERFAIALEDDISPVS